MESAYQHRTRLESALPGCSAAKVPQSAGLEIPNIGYQDRKLGRRERSVNVR